MVSNQAVKEHENKALKTLFYLDYPLNYFIRQRPLLIPLKLKRVPEIFWEMI